MSMQLSCVILNYNDAETTEKLVIQNAHYDVLRQNIVVDNASTDDSLERLRKLESDANASQSCKVRVISADHNGGYGSGNNLGVRCGAVGLLCFRRSGALPADGLHCGSDDLHFRRFRFHGSDGPRFFRFHCGFLPDGRFRGTDGLFSVPGSL